MTPPTALRRLAVLLALEDSTAGDWQPEEVASIFAHQWGAPLDWEAMGLASDRALRPQIQTYRDLFLHPAPPLQALILTKDFAKVHYRHPDSPLPRQVALALYIASIFAARVHLQQRITKLEDATLFATAQELIAYPWLDAGTRTLLQQGLALMRSPDSRLSSGATRQEASDRPPNGGNP